MCLTFAHNYFNLMHFFQYQSTRNIDMFNIIEQGKYNRKQGILNLYYQMRGNTI